MHKTLINIRQKLRPKINDLCKALAKDGVSLDDPEPTTIDIPMIATVGISELPLLDTEDNNFGLEALSEGLIGAKLGLSVNRVQTEPYYKKLDDNEAAFGLKITIRPAKKD